MDPIPPTSDLEDRFVTASSPSVGDAYGHGLSIPGYDLLRKLDHGGQGVVYEAMQRSTNRKVAVKVLRDDRPVSESAAKHFEREIRLASQLNHPNIVTVFDSGTTPDGRRFFVMDYVRGESLRDYVVRRKLDLRQRLDLLRSVCHAVAHAHSRGVIHRDLKPSNLLVDGEGRVKLLDFGLAKSLISPGESVITMTGGMPVGTLAYMSPEQARGTGGAIDARTDVYSLGVILYELLTGQLPYPTAPEVPVGEALRNIQERSPIPLRRAWRVCSTNSRDIAAGESSRGPIDRDLDTMVLRALAKECDRRYRDAGEFGADLERYLAGEPIEARRDSALYVLRLHSRRWVRQNRLLSMVVVVVLVGLSVDTLGDRAVYEWTGAGEYFLRRMEPLLGSAARGRGYEFVRLIALTDSTDVERLAADQGLEGVSTKNPRSLRRLHGRLMEQLAADGPRCVVWDFQFPGASEFDDDFVRGVRALNDAGIDVVVGTPDWSLEGGTTLSPKIAESVRWASAVAGLGGNLPWSVHAFARRGSAAPFPSLSTAAFAQSRRPRHAFELALDESAESIELHYWQPNPNVPSAPQRLPTVDRVMLSDLRRSDDAFDPELNELGLRKDDVFGSLVVSIAPDEELSAATIPYEVAFLSNDRELTGTIQGRVVLVGDLRAESPDRFDHPDGRRLSGAYAHFAAIEALHRQAAGASPTSFRMPPARARLFLSLMGAGLGGAVAQAFARHRARRFVVLAATALLCMGASVLVCWRFAVLFNPLSALFAAVIAGECCAAIRRGSSLRDR